MDLKRLPLKLIKNFADTICVVPSPAGPYFEMFFFFAIVLISYVPVNNLSVTLGQVFLD